MIFLLVMLAISRVQEATRATLRLTRPGSILLRDVAALVLATHGSWSVVGQTLLSEARSLPELALVKKDHFGLRSFAIIHEANVTPHLHFINEYCPLLEREMRG